MGPFGVNHINQKYTKPLSIPDLSDQTASLYSEMINAKKYSSLPPKLAGIGLPNVIGRVPKVGSALSPKLVPCPLS